jgi:DNA polymerase I-like protein with 3'-5' exonuclease and polymerase domains
MQLPLFVPSSDWKAPTSLPVVPSGVVLGIDTETRDNGLANDRGPGWATRDGHIAGVSVAWGGESHYIPLRHPDTDNMDPGETMAWLQDAASRSAKNVFHNSSYDTGWLGTEGVTFDPDKSEDTQHMACIANENELSYSLDNCCRREGVPGKDEAKLCEAAAAFGIDPKKDMWRLPARYVGGYAAQDPLATIGLLEKLQPRIAEQDLTDAYRLEMDIMPMCNEMRRRGIVINEDRADQVRSSLNSQLSDVLAAATRDLTLRRALTTKDINSPVKLMELFDQQQVPYPRTPKTNMGSFKSDWMQKSAHWLPQMIVRARQLHDLSDKFIGNYILGSVHLGKIHAEIHQLRDDDGGTRTYRFSYANPPLQQIPARSANGRLIRSIFEAEQGKLWYAADYSQQEPRMGVHFASLCRITGAEDAVRYYCDDPSADFHTMVAELTGLTRKQAKIINLGLMYGMGLPKLAHSLGVTLEEAQEIVNQYNARMPFIEKLNEFCEGRAQQRGFIRLLDGARCRFDKWEPKWRGDATGNFLLPYEAAMEKVGRNERKIRRANTRKAMNSLIQGSSARQTKMAMRECYRDGLIPLLQMHDEIDLGLDSPHDAARINEIMENVVKLKIPMKVDGAWGKNWGMASEEMDKGITPPTFEEIMASAPGDGNTEILSRRTIR